MKRIVAIVIVCLSAAPSGQQPGGSAVEWPYVGGDQAHTKYSALEDVNLSNVGELEIAWAWDAGETPLPDARPGSFQATPLMIDGIMYLHSVSTLFALDAGTGEELWTASLDRGPEAAYSPIASTPGKQYVTVVATNTVVTLALPWR